MQEIDTSINWESAATDILRERQETSLRNSMASSRTTTPQAESAARNNAQVLGIPVQTARAEPQAIAQQAGMAQFNSASLVQEFPNTARWLSDDSNAKLASDDVPQIAKIENAIKQASPSRRIPIPQQQSANPGFVSTALSAVAGIPGEVVKGVGGAFNSAATALNTVLGAAPALYDKVAGGSRASDWWGQHMISSLKDNRSAFETLPDAPFVQKVANQTGSLLGTLAQISLTSGATAAPGTAMAAASTSVPKIVGGAIEHGAKSMAFPALADAVNSGRDVYEATGGDGAAALKAAQASWLSANAMGVMPLSLQGTLATRAASGMLAGMATGEASRQFTNSSMPASMQSPFSWENTFLSGVSGAMLGGVMGPGPHAELARAVTEVAHETKATDTAAQNTAKLTALADASTQSKLRQLNPEAFKEFVTQSAEGSGLEGIQVDASKLQEMFQQHGIDPDAIRKNMPRVAEQLDAAKVAGLPDNAAISVPIADFALHIAGTDMQASFLQHARIEHSDTSAHETSAAFDMQQHVQEITRNAEKAQQVEDSMRSVRADLHQRLMDIGMQKDVARTNAEPLAAFYATQAERTGMLPHEFAAKYPVRFSNEVLSNRIGGFNQENAIDSTHTDKNGNQYSLKVTKQVFGADQTTPNAILVEVRDLTSGARRGLIDFSIRPDGVLTAENTKVAPDFRGKGLAEAMYKAAREAGYDIAPGKVQTDLGLAMVNRLVEKGVINKDADAPRFRAGDLDLTPLNGEYTLHQTERGAFSPRKKVITLTKQADLSTFQHELGHFFLDALSHMALDPAAHPDIKADMDAVLRLGSVPDLEAWHGASVGTQREIHEKFATGWETYLLKGEAPSLSLRRVFQSFRSWMLRVYKSLSGAPGEVSPELKGVFDRLIASEHAIKEAENVRRLTPLFNDVNHEGLSVEEWAKYQAAGREATETAIDQLFSASMRDMVRMDKLQSQAEKKLNAQFAERRAEVEQEVKNELMKEPVYRAREFLTRKNEEGGTPGARKLNTEETKTKHPEAYEVLKTLRMTSPNGLSPDVVADMFGFKSGAKLIDAVTRTPPINSLVKELTDQRLFERFGETGTPQEVRRLANEAIMNEVRTRFVASELKALGKAVGSIKDITKAAKEAADNAIELRRIRDINENMWVQAQGRSAKAAEKAFAKGDLEAAAAGKRDQILNIQLEKSARRGLEFVDSALKYLKTFDSASNREAIDLEYRDQIDALLESVDLRKSVSGTALDKREALAGFVERLAAQGFQPSIPEHLLTPLQMQHYKDMPLIEFKGLIDAVKSLEHLGKMKSKLLDGKETKEIQALSDELAAAAATLPQHGFESNRGLTRMGAAWVGLKSFGRSAEAALLKMEQMFDWVDARNPNGVLNRVVFRRISKAQTAESDMLARIKADIDAIVKDTEYAITQDKGKIFTARWLIDNKTGKPSEFTVKEMLMLAGNMGNESNAAKIAAGEKWDQSNIWQFLNENMTTSHWDFVERMGGVLESLWPEKVAMDRRLGNTTPEKIKPRPFTTPDGKQRSGWYWPIMYDPARSQDVAERSAAKGDQLFENIYAKANTDTGRMNTRNENYARPLLLDLDALPRMIKDEIHDVTHREAIIDADKFLSHGDVRRTIIKTLSQEHYDQIRPWLQSIANDGKTSSEAARGLEFFNTIAREARMRATMVGLGFRLTTALVHGGSAAMESVAELGPRWMAAGLKDFANPAQWRENTQFIFDRSGEMRNRANETDRDVREHIKEIDQQLMNPAASAMSRGADILRSHAYTLIGSLDMASALPTWMGAYKRALTPKSRHGLDMSEEDAIAYADKTVRNAHGGTGVKDLARIQRGSDFQKLFTMFYTFWNHNINRILDTAKLVSSSEHRTALKEANNWSDSQLAATVILRTLAYTIGVQAIHGAFHPPKEGDAPETWLGWFAKEFTASAFAGIPIARDLSAHFLSGKDYSVTPAASMVDAVGKSGIDAMNALTGQQTSPKALKHTLTTAGLVLNLPLGQPASTAQFLWDVSKGDSHPETAADWWSGLSHGSTGH